MYRASACPEANLETETFSPANAFWRPVFAASCQKPGPSALRTSRGIYEPDTRPITEMGYFFELGFWLLFCLSPQQDSGIVGKGMRDVGKDWSGLDELEKGAAKLIAG